MSSLAEATISLSALQHNFSIVKEAAPTSKIMAVIKADAYGHGAVKCAYALDAADAFAVARIEEAIELRQNGIQKNIIILSGIHSTEDLVLCEKHNFQAVIHGEETLKMAVNINKPLAIWLKFDTGMHRLGFDCTQKSYAAIQDALQQAKHLHVVGILSHLASAEQPDAGQNTLQKHSFNDAQAHFPSAQTSLCNSAGILWHPSAHYHWVRPGIMLYGANPGNISDHHTQQLISVMSLQAKVIHVNDIKAGESVGYNGMWTAPQASKIATISIGYADGYPRHAKQGTPVEINGQLFPLVGRVSMDLITVDISHSTVKTGDVASLWGRQIKAETIASYANTISYDLFTGITQRVTRRYIP